MEDMDKNRDGYVTVEEYISKSTFSIHPNRQAIEYSKTIVRIFSYFLAVVSVHSSPFNGYCWDYCCFIFSDDLWPESERRENPQEPSWVQSEKDQFRDYRDKDKDGKLNKVRKCHCVAAL